MSSFIISRLFLFPYNVGVNFYCIVNFAFYDQLLHKLVCPQRTGDLSNDEETILIPY